jgi:selenocysteine lyase/cysteine desulfurase
MADFPERAGHRLSIEAGRTDYNVRETLADFFNVPDPLQVIFTANATQAINRSLYGILKPGDHVITSSIEHNAAVAQP